MGVAMALIAAISWSASVLNFGSAFTPDGCCSNVLQVPICSLRAVDLHQSGLC
jgi:hypothetical protein